MGLIAVPTSPCWSLSHEKAAVFAEMGEGISHYITEVDAQRDLWAYRSDVKGDYEPDHPAWQALLASKPVRESRRCYWIECDGCHRRMVWDDDPTNDGGTHYSSDDVDEGTLSDAGWTTDGLTRHHCADCPGILTEDVIARMPGPNDISLPGIA